MPQGAQQESSTQMADAHGDDEKDADMPRHDRVHKLCMKVDMHRLAEWREWEIADAMEEEECERSWKANNPHTFQMDGTLEQEDLEALMRWSLSDTQPVPWGEDCGEGCWRLTVGVSREKGAIELVTCKATKPSTECGSEKDEQSEAPSVKVKTVDHYDTFMDWSNIGVEVIVTHRGDARKTLQAIHAAQEMGRSGFSMDLNCEGHAGRWKVTWRDSVEDVLHMAAGGCKSRWEEKPVRMVEMLQGKEAARATIECRSCGKLTKRGATCEHCGCSDRAVPMCKGTMCGSIGGSQL